MDPLDNYPVQSSWVAEATSCAQQFIHAAYRKLEPGYATIEFDKRDLATWEHYSNYPDWAARQLIAIYPENFMTPFVRQRKTSLFKPLENNLNHTRLNSDSVQAALQDYLKTFEQTCNLGRDQQLHGRCLAGTRRLLLCRSSHDGAALPVFLAQG